MLIGTIAGIPMGNSQYTIEHRSTWPNTNGNTIHDVYLCILNLDEDIADGLTVTFKINDGFDLEASSNNLNIWQAKTITQTGNVVTVELHSYASWLQVGSKLDLYFQLPYTSEDSKPEISDVTLNGLGVNLVSEF